MKYAWVVLTDPVADPVPEDKDIEAWVDIHDASGARVWGDRFADAAEAKTVRVRQDGVHVTDGPFSPAHRQIAGLDILECVSIEEAVAVALDHPMARGGTMEVRPFFDWSARDD